MISSRRSSIGQYTKRSDLSGRLQMSPRRLCIKIVNNNDWILGSVAMQCSKHRFCLIRFRNAVVSGCYQRFFVVTSDFYRIKVSARVSRRVMIINRHTPLLSCKSMYTNQLYHKYLYPEACQNVNLICLNANFTINVMTFIYTRCSRAK